MYPTTFWAIWAVINGFYKTRKGFLILLVFSIIISAGCSVTSPSLSRSDTLKRGYHRRPAECTENLWRLTADQLKVTWAIGACLGTSKTKLTCTFSGVSRRLLIAFQLNGKKELRLKQDTFREVRDTANTGLEIKRKEIERRKKKERNLILYSWCSRPNRYERGLG